MTGNNRLGRVRALFAEASGLDPAARDAFLSDRCAGDRELRKEVESLLEHGGDWAPLGTAPHLGDAESVVDRVVDGVTDEHVGTSVGGYALREMLGEGGMGTVYLADQLEPVAREVALKIIKKGMDTHQIVMRFERERQALAMMDHPGIARVYGAGSTPAGRPYFAMELVRGAAITRYCDTKRLTIPTRLKLFAALCDAVQHAHQKGVIHRDLKPSNVLVSDAAGVPVPKVIDFGIAKAAGDAFPAGSMHTAHGQMLGTPEYMSPEQTDASGLGIDTRTDIYSLGVILYELLTGRVPFEQRGDGGRPFGQLIEDICEIPAPRPSTRVGDDAEAADARGQTTGPLRRTLRGDLDWIVLKALNKRPEDRYSSADLLARDVRAFLDDRPVLASPPSVASSLIKFARRNRALVAASIAIGLSIAGGTLAIGYGLMIAREQRDVAQLEAKTAHDTSEFLTNMLASIDPDAAQGETVTVEQVLLDATRRLERGELSSQPGVQARLRSVMGRCCGAIGQYDEALTQLREALALTRRVHGEQSIESAVALEWLASVQTAAGLYEPAEANFEEAITIRRGLGSSTLPIEGAETLGAVYHWTGRYEEAERFFRETLDELKDTDPATDSRVGDMLSQLGSQLEILGRHEESIRSHRGAIEAHRAAFGETHTAVAASLNNLANTYEAMGDYAEARKAHEESLAIKRILLRPDHPDIGASLSNLGLVLIREGDPIAAETMLRDAIKIRTSELGPSHAATGIAYLNLGLALRDQERYQEAFEAFTTAISIADQAVGPDHLMHIAFRIHLGYCLVKMDRYDEAEPVLLQSHQSIVEILSPNHRRAKDARRYLVELYEAWGQPGEAERWRTFDAE
ncbi:MAG: hypothetical protein DHS20C14_17290 [Phycisphaeraceae bacterium]|nr:MAG: hypothetical protein DHS20C14_17290 [Phycisphaeraceae bacterium]